METNTWVEPTTEGKCPACGVKVRECGGIEVFAQTYYYPAEYECVGAENVREGTVIMRHRDADGIPCDVGFDNVGECVDCAAALDRMEDYDDSNDDAYEDGDWLDYMEPPL